MKDIYTLDEIKELITPVAQKHNLAAVWVFGSYARGEATENSDVDLLVDDDGSDIYSFFGWGGIYGDLLEAMNRSIDMVTIGRLTDRRNVEMRPDFSPNVLTERKLVYERQ